MATCFGVFGSRNTRPTSRWQIAVASLVPTLFVGVFCRGALLMLADAPGAENWLALHQAGLRAPPPPPAAGRAMTQARRKRLLTQALGVLLLLIGFSMCLNLVLNTPRPGEAVFMTLTIALLGGWGGRRPGDLL